jgi:alpha-beta hydrolase superfamily lysophospholipase
MVFIFSGTGTRLAKAGFEVHGVDYEGHGKSSGLQGYISNLNDVVSDCFTYFASISGTFSMLCTIYYSQILISSLNHSI